MAELTQLDSSKHGNLKIANNCTLELASKQHVMSLRATEVGAAACSFPVFLTRNSHNGEWALSAVAALEAGRNLFVKDLQWTGTYLPTALQTYPLYLMKADNEKGYAVGIDEQSSVFSEEEGEPLFAEDGKASLQLSRVTAILEADIKHDIQTRIFTEQMEKKGLLKAIDILVQYEDGAVQTLQGLHTLDEDKLQALSATELEELNKRGYLTLAHAMLISIFQLNALIAKHNEIPELRRIRQAKLEVAKDRTQ